MTLDCKCTLTMYTAITECAPKFHPDGGLNDVIVLYFFFPREAIDLAATSEVY